MMMSMMSSHRGVGVRMRAVLAALVLTVAGSVPALAGDGVQFSSECDRTYVNKQVGDTEQWAITWEIYGNATGNVFKLDGSAPSMIECVLVDSDETNEIFDCYGSSPCTSPPCGGSQWSLISTNTAVPTAFFLPPNVDPLDPFSQCEVRE